MDSQRRFLLKTITYAGLMIPANFFNTAYSFPSKQSTSKNKASIDRLDDGIVTIDGWILVDSDIFD